MTPDQQGVTVSYLQSVKNYLTYLTNGSTCPVTEPFVPELAGMVERVGVILSAINAGFYTQAKAQPLPNEMRVAEVKVASKPMAVKLTSTTKGTYSYSGDKKVTIVDECWICNQCGDQLQVGDLLTSDLSSEGICHVNCDSPQG